MEKLGPFEINHVTKGDCIDLIKNIPDESIDVIVTSPPYWGQRTSLGTGTEEDPREYLEFLKSVFSSLLKKLKKDGVCWINIGDSYNTPVNWGRDDWSYSSLGKEKKGFDKDNSAYTKPRSKRKAYIEKGTNWLQYGNLLSLPNRLIMSLCDEGYVYRGEVIWKKKNAMPEGRCRRPHRQHESIFLLARDHNHHFRVTPPVGSVWEFSNERIKGPAHFSRFPRELPRRCIEAYGKSGPDIIVCDPFTGSGTTGVTALELGCSFIGFEIDPSQVDASNFRIQEFLETDSPLLRIIESVSN